MANRAPAPPANQLLAPSAVAVPSYWTLWVRNKKNNLICSLAYAFCVTSAEYLLSYLQSVPMIDVNLGNPTCHWGPGLQSLQRLEMSNKCAMHSRGVCDTGLLSLGEGPFRSVSASPDAGFTEQGRQGPLKGGKAVLRGIMLFFLLVCAILIPTLWVFAQAT